MQLGEQTQRRKSISCPTSSGIHAIDVFLYAALRECVQCVTIFLPGCFGISTKADEMFQIATAKTPPSSPFQKRLSWLSLHANRGWRIFRMAFKDPAVFLYDSVST